MSKRLQEILRKNAEWEKETPYNFCDRWCERCTHEKQMRCRVYQDEFEQKITCIAYGKEPDDSEITEQVMRRQFEEVEEKLEEFVEENEINFDGVDDPEFEKIRKHIEFVDNNTLDGTAEQYCKRAHEFLETTFYNKQKIKSELINDFKTVSWYHTLLPAKLHRALCGFHEPVNEHEFALYDAVAQFGICKKAIKNSVKTLQNIAKKDKTLQNAITRLSALLYNILSRIELMEDEI